MPDNTFFLLVAVMFAVGAVGLWQRQAGRERQLAAFANANGLRYSLRDRFGVGGLPFEAVTEGVHLAQQRRKPARVMWGEWRRMPLLSFEMHLGEPGGNPLFRLFSDMGPPEEHRSFAVSTFPVKAAHLIIQRLDRSMPYRAPEMRADDVGFESDEFERAFRVRCSDHRFAFAVIDARMMAWLLDTPGDWSFEVNGSRSLCYSGLRETAQLEALFGALADFRSRVPSVVASSYPPAPDGGVSVLLAPSHPTEPRQRHGVSLGGVFWWIVTWVIIILMVLVVYIAANWRDLP